MVAEYVIGQIVISKSGRDKGRLLVVVDMKDQYLYLADGRLRRIETPKKKKDKHVQKVKYVDQKIKEKIQKESKLNNADLRQALNQYLEASSK